MFRTTLQELRAARLLRFGLMALGLGLLLAVPASGQMSPEEHAKHHPGKNQGGPAQGKMGGGMEGMGSMMEGMGKAPPKEQYPSLMSLPELTAERREEILSQAHARMQEGTAL